jgi:thiol-disulfide isomerase/thioredoxin
MSESLPETQNADMPKKRHVWIVWIVGLILVIGLIYGVSRALPNLGNQQDFSRFKTGSLASLEIMAKAPPQPVAMFTNIDAKPTNLAAFRGEVVLVNLWATWCAPCVTEMPTLAALQSRFTGQDFRVVTISVDRDDTRAAAIAKLNELSGGKLAFYHDPKMGVVFPMKARGFPTSVLYDREGKEIARLAGEADWNSLEARTLIEAALSKK